MPLPLRTDRLLLRAPDPADAPALAGFWSDPEAVRHIGAGATHDEAWVREALARGSAHLADKGYTMLTVVRRADGAVLGDCGLWTWADTGEPEIGWRFLQHAWGQGYGGEAARAVLAWGLEEIGLTHLITMVASANEPSWRIAERLGFQLDREGERNGVLVRRYVLDVPEPAAQPGSRSRSGSR